MTEGRSSVCGRGTPSGPTSGGSSASVVAADVTGTAGAGAEPPAAGALAEVTSGAPLGAAEGTSGVGSPGVVADDAGVETASPRQPTDRTRAAKCRRRDEHRARIAGPSILEAGAKRPSVQRPSQVTTNAAFDRFLTTRHLPGLDGLRCLAILPVIWHHSTPRLLPGVLGKGAVGVDLFFALSGFLITTLLLRERRERGVISLGAFYARRSLRIFPLYYAVLAAYVARALTSPASFAPAAHFLRSWPYHASYTANWFVDYSVPHDVIFAFSWSLCVEEQFYWVWPILLALVTRRALLAILMLSAVAFDYYAEHGALSAFAPAGSTLLRVLTSFATPIGCGSLVALLLDTAPGFALAWRVLGWRATAPLLLAASLALLATPATPYLSLSLCLAALVAAVAVRRDNGLAWLLELRAVRWIGTVSYAAYLLHITALGLVRRALPGLRDSALGVFALGLPLALVFAFAAHLLMERPFQRLRSRFH